MRLTVGPLPAAVYWRRRAVVLFGLSMVVLIPWYVLSGPNGSANTEAAPTPTTGTTTGPTPTVTAAAPSETTASPSPSAFTLPVSAATGSCTDEELEVIATADSAEVSRNTPVAFTIKIKNVSSRTCVRDIGADAQELQLRDDVAILWSSDDCGANHGAEDREFAAGMEVSFTRSWSGTRSRGGNNTVDCAITLAPDAGVYQLVARLDEKF